MTLIAALFVETNGCYFGLPDVDPWDEPRDARTYGGPYPVVAHPPCQRWGRFWHGSPRKPHQFKLGDDAGCFQSALNSVRTWGGVLEHPADTHAWRHHGIPAPKRGKGWQQIGPADWTCYVEQGHYGHAARKGTWLYYNGPRPVDLNWTRLPQRLDPAMVERHGYEYARRKGLVSMVGGKRKTEIRNATPPAFRDVLISLARMSCKGNRMIGPEERWIMDECSRQEEEIRIAEQEAIAYQEALSAEALRRGCDEDELEALWQGHATYLPDYDDHSSDDPRCEQNITKELGMHVFNPHLSFRPWVAK